MKNQILEAFGHEPGYVFFRKYFPEFKPGKNVKCPFHNDKTPSLSIMANGGWRCFGATCQRAGDIFTFYGLKNGLDTNTKEGFTEILKGIISDFALNLQKQGKHDDYIDLLGVARKKALQPNITQAITEKKGWTCDTIKKLGIGYHKQRIWFPIYDNTHLVNIRRYDIFGVLSPGHKFTSLKEAEKPIWVFPHVNPRDYDEIFLFKESDVPLAIQLGLNATSITCGEGYYSNKLDRFFENKIVYVCYDVDTKSIGGAGTNPAIMLAEKLYGIANEIKICTIPTIKLPEDKYADFTDFILMGQDFTKIIEDAETFEKEDKHGEQSIQALPIDFKNCLYAEHFNRTIEFKAMCIGSGITTYLYPSIIQFSCDQNGGDKCSACFFQLKYSGSAIIETGYEGNILEFINVNDLQKLGAFRKLVRSGDCKKIKIEVLQTENIEEIYLTEKITRPKFDLTATTQRIRAYSVGKGINQNKEYLFTGTLKTEPRSQQAINLLTSNKILSSDIDTFKLSKDDNTTLYNNFSARGYNEIGRKIDAIVEDMKTNVTLATKRDDVILATLLTYTSPLAFMFNGEFVHRGWLETLIFGDTRTGKSQTVKNLMAHIDLGSYHLCEKTTHSALVGGVTYVSKRGIVVWGMFVINDRELVVLDEASGIELEIWAKLSGVRDNGIAESNTVEGIRQATARTRKLFIANPRGNSPLKNYSSGVGAVKQLIGKPEDIARFDLLVVCSTDDVPVEEINIEKTGHLQSKYTGHMFRQLISWVWSRKPNDYKFSPQAVRLVLQYANEMAEVYSEDFPMVLGAEQRIKIARLAVAISNLMFAPTVEEYHVQYARKFLDYLYSKDACGYKQFSDIRTEHAIDKKAVRGEIARLKNDKIRKTFISNLLECGRFTVYDIRDLMGLDKHELYEGNKMKQFLLQENCILKVKTGYIKTSGFITVLKELQGNKPPF